MSEERGFKGRIYLDAETVLLELLRQAEGEPPKAPPAAPPKES